MSFQDGASPCRDPTGLSFPPWLTYNKLNHRPKGVQFDVVLCVFFYISECLLGVRGFGIDESLFLIKIVVWKMWCDYIWFIVWFIHGLFLLQYFFFVPAPLRLLFNELPFINHKISLQELSERWLLQEMVTGGKFLKDLKTDFFMSWNYPPENDHISPPSRLCWRCWRILFLLPRWD